MESGTTRRRRREEEIAIMDIALLVFYICLDSHTTANTKNINGFDNLPALLTFVTAGEAAPVDEPVRFRGPYSEGTVTTILSRSKND